MLIPINADNIYHQAVVYAYSSYFYFGGHDWSINSDVSTIARLDGTTYMWSKVGQLNERRNGHNVIHLNGFFVVVGGYGTKNTEKCEFNNDQMICHPQSPSLTDYYGYPELMTVADDFCD